VNNQLFLEIMKDGVQNAAQPNVEDEIKNKLAQLGIKPDRRNMETAVLPGCAPKSFQSLFRGQ